MWLGMRSASKRWIMIVACGAVAAVFVSSYYVLYIRTSYPVASTVGLGDGEIVAYHLPKKPPITCIAWYPNGRKIVAGTRMGTIWVCDLSESRAGTKEFVLGPKDALNAE